MPNKCYHIERIFSPLVGLSLALSNLRTPGAVRVVESKAKFPHFQCHFFFRFFFTAHTALVAHKHPVPTLVKILTGSLRTCTRFAKTDVNEKKNDRVKEGKQSRSQPFVNLFSLVLFLLSSPLFSVSTSGTVWG